MNTMAGLAALGMAACAEQPYKQIGSDTLPSATAQSRAPLRIVMLAYPDMTALDLVGPQLFFATLGNVQVEVAGKDIGPIVTDSGLSILSTVRLDQASPQADVFFVPGGLKGTTAVLHDPDVMRFVNRQGSSARWVSSVCTGSLILGGAGLLRGYRATSHWYVRNLLAKVGAEPVDARVVTDRNRVTGAGVTAGIDLAISLSALLRGEANARRQELVFEYAPQPPFASGTPELAGRPMTESVLESRRAAIESARDALMLAHGASH